MKLLSNFFLFSNLNLAESKNRRPNVILLNTDDFGIGDFQIYNREAKVPTPNIDRLGHEGVKFLSAHSGSSRCSPSRYMLMTGRYSMDDSPSRKIMPGEPNLAEMFKKSGYKTGLFGKNNPLASMVINKNATRADKHRSKQLDREFEQSMLRLGKGYKGLHPANYLPGNYEQKTKPSKYGYDYAFTNTFACCQPKF
jgi:arylsulfatase A